MSFSFRDKGRLSDRLRGKTCDEILKELRDQLHQDRSMSFDSTPSWGGFSSGPVFSRAGFPFMDQDMMQRPDMRAHFEDLASRHPEFADHLRPAAWGTVPEVDPHFFQSEPYRQRHPSGSSGSGSGVFNEDGAVPIPVIHEDSGGGNGGSSRGRTRKIPQYGLRNTVDLGESQKVNPEDTTDGEARSQRSWSAPPDNRTQGEAPNPKRFVTRVDINDKNNQPTSGGNDPTSPGSSGMNSPGKPPPFPKTSGASSPQSHQQSSKSGNVRHIPIFVEGRDEPVLPKPRDSQSFASAHSSSGFGQPNYSYSYAHAPPGSHSSAFASSHASCSPPAQRRSQTNPPHASKPHPQPSVPPEPKQSIPTKQAQAPPPKPVNPKDPIAKVQAIQAEVNEFKELVEKFTGSRSDKEYIYLDEMLTRNLIKLDDIETDGKENIRQARREAIKLIQKCISILESKAPLPQDMTVETAEGGEASAVEQESKNETLNEAVAEPSANSDEMAKVEQSETMEVECSGKKVALESQAEIPVPQDGETSNKPMDSLNVSENQQSPSEQSSEEMEVVTEQPLEKMEVVLDQPTQEIVSQPTEISSPLVEPVTDQSHTTEVTNTPEIVNTKTEIGSNVNEHTSVIAGTPVVTEGVKPSNSVEIPNSAISSEVDLSTSENANPQDSHSALDGGVEKSEAVSGGNEVTESTQSVVPANESAEKAVSL